MRDVRKWVSSRTALMTDLVLSALLGIALGVAQGRTTNAGDSVLWMLITLLAYGCMSVARSSVLYGQERHLYLQLESQGGVSVSAWVFGHQLFDLLGLLLHPATFYAWLYVLTLSQVPMWSYYTVLVLLGWYTSGIGYLVSLASPPRNVLLAGLAIALLLGGVANGVAPKLWQLEASHPLLWLDQISYTRWALQALYTSWLVPGAVSNPARAPETAAWLSQLGFCGLDQQLWRALQQQQPGLQAPDNRALGLNSTSFQDLLLSSTAQRTDAMVQSTAAQYHHATTAAEQSNAATIAALSQLWQYYSRPELLQRGCDHSRVLALAVLFALGAGTRLLVYVLVKVKVMRKASQ